MEFEIQYEGQNCQVKRIELLDTPVYKVVMKDKTIMLTQAKKQGGIPFWTCIPESTGKDQKLAEKLGNLIDRRSNNLLF